MSFNKETELAALQNRLQNCLTTFTIIESIVEPSNEKLIEQIHSYCEEIQSTISNTREIEDADSEEYLVKVRKVVADCNAFVTQIVNNSIFFKFKLKQKQE